MSLRLAQLIKNVGWRLLNERVVAPAPDVDHLAEELLQLGGLVDQPDQLEQNDLNDDRRGDALVLKGMLPHAADVLVL